MQTLDGEDRTEGISDKVLVKKMKWQGMEEVRNIKFQGKWRVFKKYKKFQRQKESVRDRRIKKVQELARNWRQKKVSEKVLKNRIKCQRKKVLEIQQKKGRRRAQTTVQCTSSKIYSLLLLGGENKNREKERERERAKDKDLVKDRPSDNIRMEYIIPVCVNVYAFQV